MFVVTVGDVIDAVLQIVCAWRMQVENAQYPSPLPLEAGVLAFGLYEAEEHRTWYSSRNVHHGQNARRDADMSFISIQLEPSLGK
jgi:hypothetical protein